MHLLGRQATVRQVEVLTGRSDPRTLHMNHRFDWTLSQESENPSVIVTIRLRLFSEKQYPTARTLLQTLPEDAVFGNHTYNTIY